jgi:hypothetical protein
MMAMSASPIAAGISYATAIFGLVGSLIGGFIAGAASLLVARQARRAAEGAWIRDNRREIYDQFLTCGQRLLVACLARKDGRRDEGADSRPRVEVAEASVESADANFVEAYAVVQTVADITLVRACRDYANQLRKLKTSVMGPENSDPAADLVRDARHATINAMRAELGLKGKVDPDPAVERDGPGPAI